MMASPITRGILAPILLLCTMLALSGCTSVSSQTTVAATTTEAPTATPTSEQVAVANALYVGTLLKQDHNLSHTDPEGWSTILEVVAAAPINTEIIPFQGANTEYSGVPAVVLGYTPVDTNQVDGIAQLNVVFRTENGQYKPYYFWAFYSGENIQILYSGTWDAHALQRGVESIIKNVADMPTVLPAKTAIKVVTRGGATPGDDQKVKQTASDDPLYFFLKSLGPMPTNVSDDARALPSPTANYSFTAVASFFG